MENQPEQQVRYRHTDKATKEELRENPSSDQMTDPFCEAPGGRHHQNIGYIGLKILLHRPVKAVFIEDTGLHPDGGEDRTAERTGKNAPDAEIFHQKNRNVQVQDSLRQGLIAIIPEKSHRFLENQHRFYEAMHQ